MCQNVFTSFPDVTQPLGMKSQSYCALEDILVDLYNLIPQKTLVFCLVSIILKFRVRVSIGFTGLFKLKIKISWLTPNQLTKKISQLTPNQLIFLLIQWKLKLTANS